MMEIKDHVLTTEINRLNIRINLFGNSFKNRNVHERLVCTKLGVYNL